MNISSVHNQLNYFYFKNDLVNNNSSKTADFAKEHPVFIDRTSHFPLLKGLGLLLLLGAVIVTIIITAPIGLFFLPVPIAGVIITLPHLKEYCKKLMGEAALSFVKFFYGKENWMHAIHEVAIEEAKTTLYLGGIPLKGYDHLNDFKTKNIRLVVSLVESWEQTSITFGGEPVLQKEWEEAEIEQLLIETPDFTAPPKEKLKMAVDQIHNALSSGSSVYVHCKVGMGRSATAVVCYLLEHQREILGIPQDAVIGPNEVEEATRYVINIRRQVKPFKEAILDYFTEHN